MIPITNFHIKIYILMYISYIFERSNIIRNKVEPGDFIWDVLSERCQECTAGVGGFISTSECTCSVLQNAAAQLHSLASFPAFLCAWSFSAVLLLPSPTFCWPVPGLIALLGP